MTLIPDDLIAVLTAKIESARQPPGRGGRRQVWVTNTQNWSAENLALIVLHCVIRPRSRDAEFAPSQLTVVEEIGEATGVLRRRGLLAADRAGAGLLDLAESVKIVEIRQEKGHKKPKRVYLTEGAKKQLAEIVDRIAAAKLKVVEQYSPSSRPPRSKVYVKKNTRGILKPRGLPASYVRALNHIRRTPWRVNQFVFETMASRLTKSQMAYVMREWAGAEYRSYVKKKDQLQAFSTANDLLGSTFYLNVFCDWRGRVYNRGPLRFTGGNHVIQPLLEFAHGARLTESGAKHLAIYIGHLRGEKDFEKAEAWTYANEDLILRVARDPKRHKKDWWRLKEQKRWHFLAAADAWRRYRERQEVHLPCSWDAVTSGLQVYALLMRDESLGRKVGLVGDSGGSFYETITEETGEARGAVKSVCIPLFYGAGTEKLGESLKEWFKKEKKHVPPHNELKAKVLAISASARRHADTFGAVSKWLGSVAEQFKEKKNVPLKWRTPQGFEVVMDNRHMRGPKVEFYLNNRRIRLKRQVPSKALDHDRQITGIAANVIQSLDANLLVATVNIGASPESVINRLFDVHLAPDVVNLGQSSETRIKQWGVVHDCFAVHPNDVYNLTMRVSKYAILQVFNTDFMTSLHRQFEDQLGVEVPPPPVHKRRFEEFWFALSTKALTP